MQSLRRQEGKVGPIVLVELAHRWPALSHKFPPRLPVVRQQLVPVRGLHVTFTTLSDGVTYFWHPAAKEQFHCLMAFTVSGSVITSEDRAGLTLLGRVLSN